MGAVLRADLTATMLKTVPKSAKSSDLSGYSEVEIVEMRSDIQNYPQIMHLLTRNEIALFL